MKRIFTLLLFTGIVSTSFAQFARNGRDFEKRNEPVFNDRHGKDDNRFYNFSRTEMQMEIFRINRFYNNKIENVKDNGLMNRYRKTRIINELECKRTDAVKAVYARFNDNCNQYKDHSYGKAW